MKLRASFNYRAPQTAISKVFFFFKHSKYGKFPEKRLQLEDDFHEYHHAFFCAPKLGKISQPLSSAGVVIGALMVFAE